MYLREDGLGIQKYELITAWFIVKLPYMETMFVKWFYFLGVYQEVHNHYHLFFTPSYRYHRQP